MDNFKIYEQADIDRLVNSRPGEIKLANRVQVYSHITQSDTELSVEQLQKSEARFVLLGIPEDIGVRANYGTAGTSSVWTPVLKAFLNVQSNQFLDGSEILVLGHFNVEEPANDSIESLRNKVSEIDALVYPVIEKIALAGKIPVVIGGGHNNAYPIIKGVSRAKGEAIEVLNIDAHADLRQMEGRHSGNGFSYALNEGYLGQYFMLGLHQNYNNQAILDQLQENPRLKALFFEDVLRNADCNVFLEQVGKGAGLELDLDCIERVLSSAETPSGFSVNQVRGFILRGQKKHAYLHICEGACRMLAGQVDRLTPKLISYLISDFVKAN